MPAFSGKSSVDPQIAAATVLELDRGTLWESVDKEIRWLSPALAGRVLTPLGHRRFLLAEGAAQRLLACAGTQSALEESLKLRGVHRVMPMDRDGAMHSYRNRPAMDDLPADVIAEPSELLNVWHLHRILALKARQLVEAAGGAADEVRVAIVGTGYTAHKALCLGLATDEPIIAQVDSCNLLEPDHTPIEELDHPGSPGHGTRVLSVLCGTFIGVVQGLRPIVYRAIDTPLMTLASSSTVAAAVKHAVQHNGCEIVLLTCGDPKQASIELADQIDSAYNNGVVIVAPAGELTTTVAFPARHSRPITVSGSTGLDLPWTAAGRGLAVDLCAPACDIIRADMLLQAGRPQPVYRAEGDGTAYAAAQVAAAAALWVAYRRQEIAAYARTWRLVEALRHCLAASAIRPPRWNERLWGAGILNIFALLGTPIPASDRLAERPSCALEKL